MRYLNISLLFLLGVATVLPSCRSRKRSMVVGAEKVKVLVKLKNVDEVNQSKLVSLEYYLMCDSETNWSQGESLEADKERISFLVKGAHSGDNCKVQVRNPNPPAEFEFVRGAGIMYESSSGFRLATDASGQLYGEALLNRSYRVKAGNAIVRIPVTFKAEMPEDVSSFLAELKCSPEFEGLAMGLSEVDRPNKRGVFIFNSGAKPGIEYECNQIQISRGKSEALYYGNLTYKFNQSTTNQKLSAPNVELQEMVVSSEAGVTIVVTIGEACKEGEVFDPAQGKCVPKPNP